MGTKERIIPNGDEVVALEAISILNKRCLRLERKNKVLRVAKQATYSNLQHLYSR